MEYEGAVRALTPRNPSCRVTLTLAFAQPSFHAFAATRLGVAGGGWGWSDLTVLEPFRINSIPPGNGLPNGNGVRDIVAGQVHEPPVRLANPMNPAPLWQGVWTATEFTPRSVELVTQTSRLDFYLSPVSPAWVSWPLPPQNEGRAAIRVVPAPAWCGVAGAFCCGALARRRR